MRKDISILIGVAVVAIVTGVLVFASGNGSIQDTSSAVANTQTSAVAVPFTKLTQGRQSTISERVNYFITSSDQLNTLWKMVDATGIPPSVDFKTSAVIAVFAGTESTSSIAVAKVEDADARTVSITLAKLDSGCTPKQQTATPYEIVIVPATSLPLAHKDIVTTATCPK